MDRVAVRLDDIGRSSECVIDELRGSIGSCDHGTVRIGDALLPAKLVVNGFRCNVAFRIVQNGLRGAAHTIHGDGGNNVRIRRSCNGFGDAERENGIVVGEGSLAENLAAAVDYLGDKRAVHQVISVGGPSPACLDIVLVARALDQAGARIVGSFHSMPERIRDGGGESQGAGRGYAARTAPTVRVIKGRGVASRIGSGAQIPQIVVSVSGAQPGVVGV